jgi:cation transport regulator
MPYYVNFSLSEIVRKILPEYGQNIYREAFNSAWEEHQNPPKGDEMLPEKGRSQGRLECS